MSTTAMRCGKPATNADKCSYDWLHDSSGGGGGFKNFKELKLRSKLVTSVMGSQTLKKNNFHIFINDHHIIAIAWND